MTIYEGLVVLYKVDCNAKAVNVRLKLDAPMLNGLHLATTDTGVTVEHGQPLHPTYETL